MAKGRIQRKELIKEKDINQNGWGKVEVQGRYVSAVFARVPRGEGTPVNAEENIETGRGTGSPKNATTNGG